MVRTEFSGTCSMLARVRWRYALVLGALVASAAFSAEPQRSRDLADLSIEELGNIQVTSVSKHAERLLDAPAAIFVITGEDIRRSGATRLPEALRLAPNLEVARASASSYAISARGFNQPNAVANKLLVLIDGRVVYTPLFSGVFWDAQDVMLEDVERIGVINVITRRSSDTQGGYAYGHSGNLERGYGARYGGAEGNVSYRAYGRVFDIVNTSTANGTTANDGWSKGQVGFRTDWGTTANGFTLQGDGYRGSLDQLNDQNSHISGANLLGRWNRDLAEGGSLRVQAYVDQTEREIPGILAEHLNIYDVDFQHSARLAWKPRPERLVWGAVSRAIRAPSRIDRDLFVPARTGPPAMPALDGGPDFVSEVVKVFEVGYRAQPSPHATYSISLFHNIYDELRSVEPIPGGDTVLGNKMEGTGDGIEAWGNYQAAKNWRLSAGGFFLRQRLRLKPDSGDTLGVGAAADDPKRQFMLRSSLDLPDNVELDVGVRYVAALPDPSVPAYTAVDVRCAWRLQRELELSVVGQNLFKPSHAELAEFGSTAARNEMARGGYA